MIADQPICDVLADVHHKAVDVRLSNSTVGCSLVSLRGRAWWSYQVGYEAALLQGKGGSRNFNSHLFTTLILYKILLEEVSSELSDYD